MDLFDMAGTDNTGLPQVSQASPLAVRMRPLSLEEVVGQSELTSQGSALLPLIDPSRPGPSSVILFGPPGTGKTTLAYLVARQGGRKFAELSAISAGVSDVRSVIAQAKRDLVTSGQETVLFVDEVHRFSKSQQDSLLPAVENRWVTLLAATTENPSFSVIAPLLSRSLLLVLKPLTTQDLSLVIRRALRDERGLDGKFELQDEVVDLVAHIAGHDARKALTILEAAASSAHSDKRTDILVEDVKAAANQATLSLTKDEHYDVASAFIKSMRGSDVDAALHYLARMLEAGEDPRFIARRIMISASEEIGMADPSILPLTVAAAQAVALIGMPEARLILAQAVVAVATAPKSNACYTAIAAAIEDVRAGKSGAVPPSLRDAHYQGAKDLGHGQGYLYAHDAPHAIASQQYLPDELVDTVYYQPTSRGHEAHIAQSLAKVREILKMR
ncbi:MAG: replication-associated recombination protein A [Actinomycetaceae bacterium]|nr:replication-associated recombination protein A [Actinomycetaceae bacterium]